MRNLPYIVAVNTLEQGINRVHIFNALFKELFNQSKNTSITGVIILRRLIWQNLETPILEYWPNPWANHPLASIGLNIDEVSITPEFIESVKSRETKSGLIINKGMDPEEIFKIMR